MKAHYPPPKGQKDEDWEPVPLTLFRSTHFGDSTDRPLKNSRGDWTYFAADVAYHLDKFKRGATQMINVWGADHDSHVKRVKAAVQAVTQEKANLHVVICQIVNFMEQGVPVKMSKRSGTFVTLKDVNQQIGRDVLRFMMLTRRPEAHFDFDFAKACEKTKDNPVFYVQYAHARACSVFRMLPNIFPDLPPIETFQWSDIPLDLLQEETELALIKLLADWPQQVQKAASHYEPHRLAQFLYEVASAFHSLWNQGNKDAVMRFIVPQNRSLSLARLALVKGLMLVIASGLEIFGVEPVQEMH